LFSWYVPLVVQFVHTVTPALAENVPTSQSWHVASRVAPVAVENLPAAHAVQTPTFVREYLPAVHVVHETSPAVLVPLPALQNWHVAADEAPLAVENFPATHDVQTEAPAAEYLPAAHGEHTLSAAVAPNVPASHARHAPEDEPPAEPEYLPVPHDWHTAALAPPTVGEYLPAAHGVQALAPSNE
jgi:hypothetical protein